MTINYTESLTVTTPKGNLRIGEIIAIEAGLALATALNALADSSREALMHADDIIDVMSGRSTISICVRTFRNSTGLAAQIEEQFSWMENEQDFGFCNMDANARSVFAAKLHNSFHEAAYIAGIRN